MSIVEEKPVVLILGAGGHARVVIDAMRSSKRKLDGILAPVSAAVLDDILIFGNDDMLLEFNGSYFIVGLGGIGDNRPRAALFDKAFNHGLHPMPAVCHAGAYISDRSTVGHGSLVAVRSIVNPGASVGINVIVNTGAIVEHDVVVGNHAHIAPGAILCGGVKIGDYAHIGAGAIILQGVEVGEGAIVGAGAVVVREVKPWISVKGVPARFGRLMKLEDTRVSRGYER